MNKIWKEIERYREAGAIHKIRGFNLKDSVSSNIRLKAAASEMIELSEALTEADADKKAKILDFLAQCELADLLLILFDLAQRRNWSIDDVEWAMLYKLNERFEIPENASI